jgi:hypothetical protein
MADDDLILEKRVHGRAVRRIAREHRTTPAAVDQVLDAYADQALAGKHLRRSLALQLARLDLILETFLAQAVAGDAASAMVCIKAEERRSTLLGLNAPAASIHSVSVIQEPAPMPTSTDRIAAAINRIRREHGKPPLALLGGNGAADPDDDADPPASSEAH